MYTLKIYFPNGEVGVYENVSNSEVVNSTKFIGYITKTEKALFNKNVIAGYVITESE